MKIVFASSRTASNKRKICQQKIDFDINASTNKLQLLSENILITLKNGFVCYFICILCIRVRCCDYSTWVWDRVASLSYSVVLVSSPFLSHLCPLMSGVYWLLTWEQETLYKKQFSQKTLWTQDKIDLY